ncbi:hypothetical protein [Nonomuraea roseola]|uniref:WXG100 family type VII secretion target n=1 Tax=Nonomuraea roseola TaxID=46179 RepID=A0ABV5Q266_9ACTN
MDPRKHEDEGLQSPRQYDDVNDTRGPVAGPGPVYMEEERPMEEPAGLGTQGTADRDVGVQDRGFTDTDATNPATATDTDTATGDVPVESAPAGAQAVPPQGAALFDQDVDQAHTRWHDLQATFVDDPRQAMEQADQLVDEVVNALTSSLTTRTSELGGRWKNTDQGDTEQLRLALRDYGAMLEQLLALSGPQK